MPGDRWLSVDEIAAHLGVVKASVYQWIERRRLPSQGRGQSHGQSRLISGSWPRSTSFVAEAKRIFTQHQLREYLENVQRIGAMGHVATDEEFELMRTRSAARRTSSSSNASRSFCWADGGVTLHASQRAGLVQARRGRGSTR